MVEFMVDYIFLLEEQERCFDYEIINDKKEGNLLSALTMRQ